MKYKTIRISKKLVQLSVTAAILSPYTVLNATTIDFGNRNISAVWNNTLKYSAGWRLNDVDETVSGRNINPNLDGGDHNFNKGLINNRVDILTEFDFRYKRKMGFRISAAGWYDKVYNDSNDSNLNLPTDPPNILGVTNGEFSPQTGDLHGRDTEILDAFVFGTTKVAGGYLSAKIGQFAQLYGESLFFGANGVANAQASPDIIKALSVPGSQVKEILRPAQQIDVKYRINSQVTIGGYYMFEWEPARLPGSGSYFSFADHVGAGGNVVFFPDIFTNTAAPLVMNRNADISPSDSGQFGLQAKYKYGDTEFGLYVTNHHDKIPQFYMHPQPLADGPGSYSLVYAEDIETYGLSVSTLVGETNLAAEFSYRDNTPLMAVGNTVITPVGVGDGDENALYPVGSSFHLNVSAITLLNASALWDGATLLGEAIYNRVDSIDKNADQLDPNATRSHSAFRVQFTPEYFQVFSGVDLQVPMSLGYGISGRSSVLPVGTAPPKGIGDFNIGANLDFAKVWQAGISYTQYFGDAGAVLTPAASLSYDQLHKDRDFISFNIKRTF